ncbi:TIR domain-containing protein [Luedemannella helvata]|uniref:TIR domain-containing protein n=1 Tax=Luedemannella helvata TaxID=349315 RepID=UPI0031D3554D
MRVFLSYAQESAGHVAAVRQLWELLRRLGVDARVALPGPTDGRDWALWTQHEIRSADVVLVIASPAYASRAAAEASFIRELLYRNLPAGKSKFRPLVLPGRSVTELPDWFGPTIAQHTRLRVLDSAAVASLVSDLTGAPPAPGHHEVSLRVSVSGDDVYSRVELAGTVISERVVPLPWGFDDFWQTLTLPAEQATAKQISAGRRLGRCLFDEDSLTTIKGLAGTGVLDVVVECDDDAIDWPFELIRLPDDRVLATIPGVRMTRRSHGVRAPVMSPTPGPLKILVVVPGDVPVRSPDQWAGLVRTQVRLLAATTVTELAQALAIDAYHVLHLADSATDGFGLADLAGLVRVQRAAGRTLPLVVLAGATAGVPAALGLLRAGADRVVTLQAPASPAYTVGLYTAFYRHLTAHNAPVAAALGASRAQLGTGAAAVPEFGLATLVAAAGDRPLCDPIAPPVPLLGGLALAAVATRSE